MKHNAHEKCLNIVEMHDGLDFQYKLNSHSNRLIQFVMAHFIAKHKHTRQLISHNEQNGTYHYKYTNILELAPVCRDDLVILDHKTSKVLGGIGPLVLVYKVTTSVHFVDIHTMRTIEIDGPTYYKHQFTPVCSRERLTEFVVINIEDVEFNVDTTRAAAKNKFKMVRLELARASDFGQSDKTFTANTHLGEFINYNDTVLAYDLAQITHVALDEY